MRLTKVRELTPPERARSYEEFCKLAADTQYEAQTGSLSGWDLVATLITIIPGMLAIMFIISITDPDPATWWQWFWAVVTTALAVYVFSFPMRTGFRGSKRYMEVQRLWKLWHERLEHGQVPRWESAVDDFVPPPGTPPWPNPTAGSTAVAVWSAGEPAPPSSRRRAAKWAFWVPFPLFLLVMAVVTASLVEPPKPGSAALGPASSHSTR